jgi:hypothetical protein
MKFLLEYEKYNPEDEYRSDSRRSLNLDLVRKSVDYKRLIELGFKEDTSHQQEINNTLKFIRTTNNKNEKGHDKVFYTIHPTGKVRRYNPIKSEDNPGERMEGNGNDIKDFGKPFRRPSEYAKGLRYLWQYIKRKQERGNYR